MKLKDLFSESAGTANPYVAMASSIDFALRQVENLEKIIGGIQSGVPGSTREAVRGTGEAAKRHVSNAATQLRLARETVKSHSDAPISGS